MIDRASVDRSLDTTFFRHGRRESVLVSVSATSGRRGRERGRDFGIPIISCDPVAISTAAAPG